MDPAKRASVGARSEVRDDAQLEEQVKDWLRYGEDLGLAPYYRDRPPLHVIAEAASTAPHEAHNISTSNANSVAAPAAMAAAAPSRASSTPINVAPSSASQKSPAATILPATEPSLFEAIERIAGDTLPRIREDIGDCTRCKLHKGRTKIVLGTGNPNADLMFVGEGPGRDEDAQGEPFVGRAGQLLTKIIKAMGFAREEVYIANILKCRPDTPGSSYGNRPPTPSEMQTCRPYLMEQIAIIRPKVIVALGAVAVEGLLGTRAPMRELRGRWDSFNGTPLMVTYHPAYLLRNQSPSEKRKVWEDMMLVLERLEKPISEKQRNYFL